MSSIAGRVAVVPQGEYVATRQYDRLDVVTVGNSSYIAKKKPPIGTAVSNTTYWNKIVDANWGQIGGTLANQTDLKNALDGKANATHSHDDRYYTESEIDTKLGGKANSSHTHTKSEITDFAHNHDDRYYTESEIDTKVNATETEIRDLKMLGWTVPKECPIQNSVADGKFTQRVGRVDLGSLTWTLDGANRFYTRYSGIKSATSDTTIAKMYCHELLLTSKSNYNTRAFDKNISSTFISASSAIFVYDTEYEDAVSFKTAMNGVYLYYELATPIEITIDGHETTALGSVGDAWNSTTTYSVGAYVIYQNALYRCKTQNSGQVPTNASYWEKTSVSGEISEISNLKNAVTDNMKNLMCPIDVYDGSNGWNNDKASTLISWINQNATNKTNGFIQVDNGTRYFGTYFKLNSNYMLIRLDTYTPSYCNYVITNRNGTIDILH